MRSSLLTLLCIAVVLSLGPLTALAGVLNVPADFPTIQGAIDAADPGDCILVAPGTYVENIDFLGKAITVMSSGGAAVTTIDGNAAGSVVSFVNGESETSVIDGFTITNGSGVLNGGGINCEDAFPTIINNTISGNTCAASGAGISLLSTASFLSIPGNIVNNT